jgi:hypothetical protein
VLHPAKQRPTTIRDRNLMTFCIVGPSAAVDLRPLPGLPAWIGIGKE